MPKLIYDKTLQGHVPHEVHHHVPPDVPLLSDPEAEEQIARFMDNIGIAGMPFARPYWWHRHEDAGELSGYVVLKVERDRRCARELVAALEAQGVYVFRMARPEAYLTAYRGAVGIGACIGGALVGVAGIILGGGWL